MYKLYILAVIELILLGSFISFHSNNKTPHTPEWGKGIKI